MKPQESEPKEMVGGCCVCSDENGWTENPLVYCDGQGCNVAVHQACYGIVTVPTGAWFCRKCESQERAARVHSGGRRIFSQRCELCPSKDGALKRTDSGGWAHVVCALYIPEVRFGNVTTMEPIMLQLIPQERFNKSCYICEESGKESRAIIGACMQCNKSGCKQHFHVTCAQSMGLLCEEAGNYLDNVKYCGYCQYHFSKLRKGSHVKTIPPYRPVPLEAGGSDEEKSSAYESRDPKMKKRTGRPPGGSIKPSSREGGGKVGDMMASASGNSGSSGSGDRHDRGQAVGSDGLSVTPGSSGVTLSTGSNSSILQGKVESVAKMSESSPMNSASQASAPVQSLSSLQITPVPSSAITSAPSLSRPKVPEAPPHVPVSGSHESPSQLSAVANPPQANSQAHVPVQSEVSKDKQQEHNRKLRRNGPRTPSGNSNFGDTESIVSNDDAQSSDLVLNICEEKNLSAEKESNKVPSKPVDSSDDGGSLNVQFTPNVSTLSSKASDPFTPTVADFAPNENVKRGRTSSQDRGRRAKRGMNKRGRPGGGRDGGGRDSGASSPDSFTSESAPQPKRGRKKTESKDNLTTVITNGVGANTLLLGNQLNPASAVAQKMTDTLHAELEAHSIYKDEEEKMTNLLVGPAIPGKKENPNGSTSAANSQPPPFPQSLEQLLERQWEQGSQFLMEQAQHFDIASLLSCLHQLRQENVRLEETVSSLIARRDHLLAVNARLSVPLNSPSTANANASSNANPAPSSVSGSSSSSSSSSSAPPPQPPSAATAHAPNPRPPSSGSAPAPPPPRPHSQGHHPPGGSTHPSGTTPVGGSSGHRGASPHDRRGPSPHERRGTSPHDRRGPPPPLPVENGLGEPEYRYRSPGTEHRQQSPMLPPVTHNKISPVQHL
ncbi:mixed-lineage leukemia protein [Penaeus vannamei]|uniref:Mixed-lineage leukemia protein n=1 Tax=Penaeus vannamei TaxID=6689 RepID=A0A423TQB3_PENVA|nr:mixed-lineage leukemia protein [Penaeus vannamei]